MSNVCAQDPQTTANSQVEQLLSKARAAQATFESFSQETVDAIVRGIAKYVYDNAEMLARMAVDETGIGVYEDKILKNKGKARCTLVKNLSGSFRHVAKPGANSFKFSGRVDNRKLSPGRYRLTAVAVDEAKQRSAPATARFSIVTR